MKKIYLLIALAAAAFASSSCDDGFLDKTPLDKLSEDAVFNSASLAESYVNALYTVLLDPFQEGNVSAITDEGFFRYGGTSTRYIASGNMSASNVMYMNEGGEAHNTRTTTLNIWNRTYEWIYKMNYFIDYMTNKQSKIEADAKTRLLGEVYFLRAWSYYNLIQRYAGVPIIDKPYNLDDEFKASRANFDDCVDFVLSDLDKAEELLPAKDKCALGRINKDIVLALRCRLTLVAASPLFNDSSNPQGGVLRGTYDQGKWERAYQAAKAIVDSADVDGAYALDPTYDGYWNNKNSKELIWAKYFISSADASANNAKKAQLLYSVVYFNGWTSLNPTQAMLLDYEMANGKKIFEDGSGYDPKHPFAGRDPRFYKTVAAPFSTYCSTDNTGYHEDELLLYLLYDGKTMDDFAQGKKEPDYTSKAKHLWHATNTMGVELNKWYIPTSPITESEVGSLLYPWFRLAEMYLNLAECAYNTGREAECRQYINKVRARADVNMPPVTETGSSLWDRVVNERRIEFAFEFMRIFDVRRWKTAPYYENVPFAGMRTMLLQNGNKIDTVYRVVRPYDESKNNTCYYWTNSTARQEYIAANGEDITNVITYRWLGKDYKIDYGDCCLTVSPTQKKFPQNAPSQKGLDLSTCVITNEALNDGIIYPNYLMPIPENEMAKSNGTLEQNPGY